MAIRPHSGIGASAVLVRVLGATTLALACMLLRVPNAAGLTINLVKADPAPGDPLNGGPGGCDIGQGNLDDIVSTAAGIWQQIIRDRFVVTLDYRWAPVGGGQHTLLAQGGSPNRETEGLIELNNDCIPGHFHWFLDPTPESAREYHTFNQERLDLGGGSLVVARFFGDPTGDAAATYSDGTSTYNYVDLLPGVMHEMGHALGLSLANSSFQNTIATDGNGNFWITITKPLPYSGTVIPLATNNSGVVAHIGLLPSINGPGQPIMTGVSGTVRALPSPLDILAIAEVSKFKRLTLRPVGQKRGAVQLSSPGMRSEPGVEEQAPPPRQTLPAEIDDGQ